MRTQSRLQTISTAISLFGMALVAGLLLTASHVTTVRAASFTVNSHNDQVDANIGDGTATTSSGTCTLRAAIQEANALASGGPHTITLPAGNYDLTIAGEGEDNAATGDLDIKASVTIIGAGVGSTFIDANPTRAKSIDRVFDIFTVPPVGTMPGVKIIGVTIRGGHITLPNQAGGGIRNVGTLTLDSVDVSDNESGGGAGVAYYLSAGGIYNRGTLTLIKSTVTRNKANHSCGGIQNVAGSLNPATDGTLNLTDSTVSRNEALGTNTQARGDGGGIVNGSGSTAVLNNSTISGNIANNGGGIKNTGDMTLTNCTISGNVADKGNGGAIYCESATNSVELINCTVTGNTPSVVQGTPSAIYLMNNGNNQLINCTVSLKNTIVDEGGAGCRTSGSMLSLTSKGYNIDRGTSCGLTSDTDRKDTDPLLGPLSANGGSTLTHALLPGSPAIDKVPVYVEWSEKDHQFYTDQRGIGRPQFPCPFPSCYYTLDSVLADIGAYEFVPGPNVIPL
jgi:CSLREA domain-containing protein